MMHRRNAKQRRGAILVVTLSCLLVTLSVAATIVAGALAQRRQLRAEHAVRQAEVVVAAAAERALAALDRNPEYDGETWTPAMPAPTTANVSANIRIDRGPARSEIVVRVTYTLGDRPPVRRSGEFPIPSRSVSQKD